MQRRNSYLIGKAFKSYIVASVLTVASTQVANIVDAAIVGNLIGPEALASVNLCKPVLQAFFSFSCLYVASATMMAGVAIGQGDKRKADKFFSFAVVRFCGCKVLRLYGCRSLPLTPPKGKGKSRCNLLTRNLLNFLTPHFGFRLWVVGCRFPFNL